MSVIASDTFTDADGTALASHTPDSGGAWVAQIGTMVITNLNRARGATGTPVYTHSAIPATAEYDVEAAVHWINTTNTNSSIIGRCLDSANYYHAFCNVGITPDRFQLSKTVAGSITLLAFYNDVDHIAGDIVTLKLEIRDATKKLYVDGVLQLTSADNALTLTGLSGIKMNSASNASGQHLDNWSCTDLSSSAAAIATGSGWETVKRLRRERRAMMMLAAKNKRRAQRARRPWRM